jgi:hypothetical protein
MAREATAISRHGLLKAGGRIGRRSLKKKPRHYLGHVKSSIGQQLSARQAAKRYAVIVDHEKTEAQMKVRGIVVCALSALATGNE